MTDETIETPAAEAPQEAPAAPVMPKPGAERPQATGKRKNSIARVIINRGGDGSITCNGRPIDEIGRAHV